MIAESKDRELLVSDHSCEYVPKITFAALLSKSRLNKKLKKSVKLCFFVGENFKMSGENEAHPL